MLAFFQAFRGLCSITYPYGKGISRSLAHSLQYNFVRFIPSLLPRGGHTLS
uniref:Uncharacterized protein n=1 Tax=Utricularia reniformis TaxID=192314 RepID=A0A1Y0AZK7_9LAMI|nr:hypothetical protein AEK19_MT0297 [Utricularia reniformis]ART30573.1 hypothetical protein AEK19_MT0297 [Utricularia reniformis]